MRADVLDSKLAQLIDLKTKLLLQLSACRQITAEHQLPSEYYVHTTRRGSTQLAQQKQALEADQLEHAAADGTEEVEEAAPMTEERVASKAGVVQKTLGAVLAETRKFTTKVDVLRERLETMIELELHLDLNLNKGTTSPKLSPFKPYSGPGREGDSITVGEGFELPEFSDFSVLAGSTRETDTVAAIEEEEATLAGQRLDDMLINGELDADSYAHEISKLTKSSAASTS